MCRSIFMVVLLFSWAAALAFSAEVEKQPLRVLYLARDMDAERQEAYMSFLEANFAQVSTVPRSEFQPVQVQDVDVVLVDWSQREPRQGDYRSPLGDLDDWSTPTVFLGSAGLLMAGPWHLIGGVG
jgi:hypothetical protein